MKCILLYTVAAMFAATVLTACSKTDESPKETSSLTIVNAVSGSSALVPDFSNGRGLKNYKTALQIPTDGFLEFSGYNGTVPLSFSQITDTTKVLFQHTLNLPSNGINSLFLMGSVANTDMLLTTDQLPHYLAADSLIGVRFINLSMGSVPVSVNLKGKETVKLADQLDYKSFTGFLPFSAKNTVPATVSYIFEIRDASTAKLLTTYTLSGFTAKLSKNVTIAFKGIPAGTGTNAQSAILVNNY
ncbi:MAG TPA: hypothetical protein VGC08_03640 [Pedobacter sp.]